VFRRALDAVGHQKKRSLTRTFSARRLHTPLHFEVAPANRIGIVRQNVTSPRVVSASGLTFKPRGYDRVAFRT